MYVFIRVLATNSNKECDRRQRNGKKWIIEKNLVDKNVCRKTYFKNLHKVILYGNIS